MRGEWGCKKGEWTWSSKFPHPKISLKEFEEDLDFFDEQDGEEEKDTFSTKYYFDCFYISDFIKNIYYVYVAL